MALSDAQIDRYSRQIILGQIGGRGQQRILKSRLSLIGELTDAADAIAYLVGAGIGRLDLNLIDSSQGDRDRVSADMRGLNPDTRVTFDGRTRAQADLILALIATQAALDAAIAADRARGDSPMIAARLDTPGAIVIVPGRRPCLLCAGARLTRPPAQRNAEAALIAMVAAAEAIKMLASNDRGEGSLVDFDGRATRSQTIAALPNCPVCRDA